MNEPSNALGWAIWKRGLRLGLQWVGVVFVVTLLVWLLMGVIGWSGALRALCAMGIGPVLALGGIVAWWVFRRPALLPAIHEPPADADSTLAGAPRQTGPLGLKDAHNGGEPSGQYDTTDRHD